MSDEQEGFVRPASADEVSSWNAQSLRGTAVNAVNSEYEISKEEQAWNYTRWHRTNHRTTKDPQCKLCQLDTAVKEQTKSTPPCKQCGYKLEQHLGPTRECPV